MSYIDGFVIPVPSGKRSEYRDACARAARLCEEYGATRIVECWGRDVPEGKLTDFQRAVQAKDDETVVFSWIVWPSKEIRDAANEMMKDDPRMHIDGDMPFDGMRVIMGGFDVLFDTNNEPEH